MMVHDTISILSKYGSKYNTSKLTVSSLNPPLKFWQSKCAKKGLKFGQDNVQLDHNLMNKIHIFIILVT